MPMVRKIVASRETVDFDERGLIRRNVLVEYTLSDEEVTYGPFSLEVPKKQFDWHLVSTDMQNQESGILGVLGA